MYNDDFDDEDNPSFTSISSLLKLVSFWIFESFTVTNNTAAKISNTRISITTIMSLFSCFFLLFDALLCAPFLPCTVLLINVFS